MIERKVLKILEYDKIIEMLSEEACSAMTRQVIAELQPFTDISQVSEALAETAEGLLVLQKKQAIPLGNFRDIYDHLKRTLKGASLDLLQLFDIRYHLSVCKDVEKFMSSDLPELKIIDALIEVLEPLPQLLKRINDIADTEDEIKDTASAKLRSIRRDILKQNDSIKTKLNKIISSTTNQNKLQDQIVTMRAGRYVIPVKLEYKSSFKGIVHDQSSSGATLFIEPQEIVSLNNQLRELEIDEKKEIDRILAEISMQISQHAEILINNQNILIALDVIMSKAKLALSMDASAPKINSQGIINLVKARHPLLDVKKAVPIDIELGKKNDVLVVTGPNTGGKTVTIKTVGLLTIMAQSGLFIPAWDSSNINVFEDIYADIGDEQSIEQSLSTFSSHMKNIVYITNNISNNSLVLLDELGAGTDPTEGAALAIAILEYLKENGAKVVATTHYNELKKYAIKTDSVENASMEFDINILSPTYRLIVGVAGKSQAFEIASKLGLGVDIIANSKELLDTNDIVFQDVLEQIEKDRKYAEEERDEAIALNVLMKKRSDELERREKTAKDKYDKLIAKAKEEARAILDDARKLAKDAKKEVKNLQKNGNIQWQERRLTKLDEKIVKEVKKNAPPVIKDTNRKPLDISKVKIGDRVKVLSIDQIGQVISLLDSRGEFGVQVGILKLKSKPTDLQFVADGSISNKKNIQAKIAKLSKTNSYGNAQKRTIARDKTMSIKTQVDVRGLRLEEAVDKVSKYIDDALLAGIGDVMVVHGRGEGILKKGIHEMLQTHPYVKRFERPPYDQGGDGATRVYLGS
ncbi:MAG: endonuclease MutS2 [Eubacteriales bacterium]|nr:endonuclease MutS2 [Eubacteriales bacterium]MDY3332676.1 endonuclease MutS2 [Gallibacter sp.]